MKIGLIGCGNIGGVLANAVDEGKVPNSSIVVVFDRDVKRAGNLISKLKNKPRLAATMDEFLSHGMDIVVEAASQDAVKKYVGRVLEKGFDILIMSDGALLDEKVMGKVESIVKKGNQRVHVPSGSICGLDGVKSASIGKIKKVKIITKKPPRALEGARFIKRNRIDLNSLKKPRKLFSGSAKDAVKLFPENVNVCAALSLVGIGPDKTFVEVIVDPKLKRNTHEIFVEGDFGNLHTITENIPSPNNPKTSYLACLSAIKTLRELEERLLVGT